MERTPYDVTPEERTIVLQAVLNNPSHLLGGPICPTSWMTERLDLGQSNEAIVYNWRRLGIEEQLLIWIQAPDSDYEFARDHTFVMKGSNVNTLKTFKLTNPTTGTVASPKPGRRVTVIETSDPKHPVALKAAATALHHKMTPAEFKQAKAQAVAVTGYGPNSPIWGKQLAEVLDEIEVEVNAGDTISLGRAKILISELRKRTLTRKLTFAK